MHLFDRLMQGRKPNNIGMFVGTLVSLGGDNVPFWRDIHTFRSTVAGSPQWIPAFLDAKDDSYVPPAVVKTDSFCSFHVGILTSGHTPVPLTAKGVKCPTGDTWWGECTMRE